MRVSQKVSLMKTVHALAILSFLFSLAIPFQTAEAAPFRHFISMQFKDGTTAEQIDEIAEAFLALKGQIDQIVEIEWGESSNVPEATEGYTHCCLVTFENKAKLGGYRSHPAHKAFAEVLKPHLERIYVFDYFAKSPKP